jgi:GTPase SAR1 family protein
MSEPFKVALVGPSGVGKTTLVTAILSETEDLLSNTKVTVVTEEKTASRVRAQKKELYSAIAAGEFNAEALRNTQEMSVYDLMLQADGEFGLEVPFSVLDYPGGWLDPELRTEMARRLWPLCEAYIRESVMLLLPIDSALLMEAVNKAQLAAVPDLLGIVDVETVAVKWARARASHPDEPAVVVLAPLKCEKYFEDNGGSGHEADDLERRVAEIYGEVLRKIRKQTPGRDVRVVYAPIDTYGCVQLMEHEWKLDTGDRLEFRGSYRFRGRPPKISVKAAGTVMQELCRCIVSAEAGRARREMSDYSEKRSGLLERKAEEKGFWGTIGYYMGGEAWQNRQGRKLSEREILAATAEQAQLEEAVRKLASTDLDLRVRIW